MRVAGPTAFAVMLAGSSWSAPAAASDLGCKVLLCLSNPGGPMQYAACVQPMETLWRDLAQGKPFPSCSEGGVADTKTKGKRDSATYRVIMTSTDGSKQTYSLVGISSLPTPTDGSPALSGSAQP